MSKILISTAYEDGPDWLVALAQKSPNWDIRLWNDGDDFNDPWLKDVEYLVAAKPAEGLLTHLPNLKVIQSTWAGIEHVTNLEDYSFQTPIVRMVDIGMTQGMVEFVVGRVLYYHKDMHIFAQAEREHRWAHCNTKLAWERNVSILGLGELGSSIAKCLNGFGFQVSGWSRSQKDIDGVTSYSGEEGLMEMLSKTEILICMLPRTPQTEDILNHETIGALPDGACLINVARGEHLVVEALLSALETGKLAHATLDVFRKEPLSETCPYWDNHKVTITPHVAADTRLDTGVETVYRNLKHLIDGGDLNELAGVVDLDALY